MDMGQYDTGLTDNEAIMHGTYKVTYSNPIPLRPYYSNISS